MYIFLQEKTWSTDYVSVLLGFFFVGFFHCGMGCINYQIDMRFPWLLEKPCIKVYQYVLLYVWSLMQ